MPNRSIPILLVTATLLAVSTTDGRAVSPSGAAELSLDRASVRGLIGAALPGSVVVDVPGAGGVSVRLGSPGPLVFRDGGIETVIPIEIDEPRSRIPIAVRFEADVEPLYGGVRLSCVSAAVVSGLTIPFDLAPLFDPVALPRRLDWSIELDPVGRLLARARVQGVEIRDDRLVLLLGLEIERGVSARDRVPA